MFQQLILIGNLGSDPEMRYTSSGVPVTNFSLAVNRRWTGQDGQQHEKTIWFRVSAWRRQAELASQYLTKGRQVMVIGELEEPRVYTDRNGENRASLDVTAQNIRFIGSREDTAMASAGAMAEVSSPQGGDAPGDEDIPF